MKRILLAGILGFSGFLPAEDTRHFGNWSAPATPVMAVPNPTVTGPIPANVPPGDPSHDYPFFSTYLDLAAEGYVEEEFFLSGTANRYETPLGETGSVISSGYPYKTRMIVRRPASEDRFNGVVIVEWQVANGFDCDAHWATVPFQLMRDGFAWVGVSATANGVHNAKSGLKKWSPIRYGTLDLQAGGVVLDNSLCYDVYSQAVQAIRNPIGVDPLGGLPTQRLILASGTSAYAEKLVTYHNSIHPLHNLVRGYLLWSQFNLLGANWALRTDLNTFVFQVLSETDVILNASRLQEDSPTFHCWQIAGAAHVPNSQNQYAAPLYVRDSVVAQSANEVCSLTRYSLLNWHYSLAAATEHLVRWVKDGIEPPDAPPLQVESYGSPFSVLARDSFGLALGGLRLPEVAVPTAMNSGINGPKFCLVLGTHTLFDDATLNALYRNHGAYVSLFNQAVNDSLRKGYLLEPDADVMREAAAVSPVPPQK